MTSYKIVLTGKAAIAERTGYVFCSTDEQAHAAAETLLRLNARHRAVTAYDGDRLVCEILREGPSDEDKPSHDVKGSEAVSPRWSRGPARY